MGLRNDDISLKLIKANKSGFLPDIGDNEIDSIESEALRVYSGDTQPGPNDLAVGESTIGRREISANSGSVSTQSLRLTYFTARKTETISQISTVSGATAAAATPTLIRWGIYKVEDNGNLTLIASTANDTTLFSAIVTSYTRPLIAPFLKERGQRYAVGILVVSAVATPTFHAHTAGQPTMYFAEPRQAALLNAQADLPNSITAGSLAGAFPQYHVLLP